MKKVIMIMAMALMVSTMSFAQQQNANRPRRHFDKTEMTKMRTERMVKELNLNAAQADSLLALNTEYADVMAGLRPGRPPRPTLGNDTTKVKSFRDMIANGKEQMEKYDKRLKSFLTAEQAKKYDEIKANRKANFRRRPGMQGRRPGMGQQNGQQLTIGENAE